MNILMLQQPKCGLLEVFLNVLLLVFFFLSFFLVLVCPVVYSQCTWVALFLNKRKLFTFWKKNLLMLFIYIQNFILTIELATIKSHILLSRKIKMNKLTLLIIIQNFILTLEFATITTYLNFKNNQIQYLLKKINK